MPLDFRRISAGFSRMSKQISKAIYKGLLVTQILLIACILLGALWQPVPTAALPLPSDQASAAETRPVPAADTTASNTGIRPEQRRVALVIGNGGYPAGPLRNPANDARMMGEALRSLGFDVVMHENAGRRQMHAAIGDFRKRLESGGVGLVYFAGHGLQAGDRTLMVPVDADIASPQAVLEAGVDLRTVLAGMSAERPGKLNLVILDMCLNDPTGSGAAAVPQAPGQTLIAYATSAGSYAADGARHGVFTGELLKAIGEPGEDAGALFRRVGAAVQAATGRMQTPQLSSSLSAEFRFATGPRAIAAPTQWLAAAGGEGPPVLRSRAILPKDSAEQYELTFWESIKDSTHASDYEAYLQSYPNGRFAGLAKARIQRLKATAPKAEPAPPQEQAKPSQEKAPPPQEQARPARPPKAAPEQARPARPAPPAPPPAAASASPPPPVASQQPARAGEIQDCPTCPVLVSLRPGSFNMGSDSGDLSEKPAHRVTIRAPFAIGKYEVTIKQWNACAETGECPRIASMSGQPDNAPIRDVSWDDAQQYIKWLTKSGGQAYRLPTEAEWEYAAKGGTSSRYWWGDQMRSGNGNCKDCGEPWRQDGPAPVGSFAANPFGLHDMNGSVWEWVSDCWHNGFKGAPSDGTSWDTPNCRVRTIRGGSWREGASYMTTSTRFKYDAGVRQAQNGFRVARDVK
jgi:formylglycine-generating enzyme required for sulfatase activity